MQKAIACLLELRRRGIACEWLAASSCVEAAEKPPFERPVSVKHPDDRR